MLSPCLCHAKHAKHAKHANPRRCIEAIKLVRSGLTKRAGFELSCGWQLYLEDGRSDSLESGAVPIFFGVY